MADDTDTRSGDEAAATLIDSAAAVVRSTDTHGDAVETTESIADAWTWYLSDRLDRRLTGTDVANMMILLNLTRTSRGRYDVDHSRDVAGYAGIAAACAAENGIASPADLTVDEAGEHE